MSHPQPAAPAPAPGPVPTAVDVRGPRFGAGVTFVLGLVALFLGLLRPIDPTALTRALSPEFLLLLVTWIAFGIGTVFGLGASPWGLVFRHWVRPRLRRPAETEDPRPPRFALGVGFVITTIGLVLHLAGVPYGLVVASAAIVIASFLNAFVGYCLGCQAFLLLVRAGIIRPRAPLAG